MKATVVDLPYRELEVPSTASGMRLDRFLARRFTDRSRAWLARGIRAGQVRQDGAPMRAADRLRGGERLELYLPGIAPGRPPPPLPPILYEDHRLVVFDKPAGMLAHPVGTDFAWALVGLARARYPGAPIDLVHRLDRDTSGAIVVTRDPDANRFLKDAVKRGRVHKEYQALCRGEIPWDRATLDGPIGSADGIIRIQMAVREDGLSARTDVEVVARQSTMTWVRCVLHTGRTHQIRVHLAHAGFSLVGDRMYGREPDVFLRSLEVGNAHEDIVAAAGAPRQALHAALLVLPHPDGGEVRVEAPFPEDLSRWWSDPSVLPHDAPSDHP